MKNVYQILFTTMVVVILLAPVLLLVLDVKPEWNETFVGVVGTALSLIAGIPIALWLDRQKRKEENRVLYKKDRDIEFDVLEQIEEELSWNYDRSVDNERSIKKNFDPLKNEYWEAAKSSTLLTKIENPELLNRIASAYHVVNHIIFLEAQAVSHFDRGNEVLDIKSRWSSLIKRSKPFHILLKKSINEAKKMIQERKDMIEVM